MSSAARGADALLLQEHHLPHGVGLERERAWARGEGWKLVLGPASYTGEFVGSQPATSAGVGVGTKAGQGLADSVVRIPQGSLDRLCTARWEAWLPGGVDLMSIYLHHSEGLSARNMELLNDAGAALKKSGRPYVAGGGLNVPPEVLEASGWLTKVKGVIVRASSATTMDGSFIDYFIVHKDIACLVMGIEVLYVTDTSPHWPVKITFRCGHDVGLVRMLKKPREFPRGTPSTCCDQENRWLKLEAYEDMKPDSKMLDKFYGDFAATAEQDLAHKYGVSADDMGKDKGFGGRANLPEFVMVKPSIKGSGFPRASERGRGWRGIANGFKRILTLLGLQASAGRNSEREGLLKGLRKAVPWERPGAAHFADKLDANRARLVKVPGGDFEKAGAFAGAKEGWYFGRAGHGIRRLLQGQRWGGVW